MRSLVLLLCSIGGTSAFPSDGAKLSNIQSVYLMPMGNSLDQFLANRLAEAGIFQVVTDPKRAEAVFTDRLGEAFEQQFERLFPEGQPAEGRAEAAEPAEGQKGPSEAKPAEQPQVSFSSSGRGKGNVFLVDVRSRAVLWSTYARPKNASPEQLDRTARRITARLNSELKGK